MSYFEVTIQIKGKKVNHTINAKNKNEALQIAKVNHHGIIIKVVPAFISFDKKVLTSLQKFKNRIIKKKIHKDRLIALITQLAVMTNAGLGINNCIENITNSTTHKELKPILTHLLSSLNSGQSLFNAAKKYQYELGNLTLSMIKLGEKTGNLTQALYDLASMLEEIQFNIKRVKKAIVYPRNIMITMAIAFPILLTFVVPKFEIIFNKLNSNLPFPTLILLETSNFLRNYTIFIILGITICTTIFIYMFSNVKRFTYTIHNMMLHIKIIKSTIFYTTISKFMLVFTKLIQAGIPIAEALDIAVSMVDNLVLKKKLKTVENDISKGMSLVDAFRNSKLFENMILEIIKAGEISGQLDSMLNKVSNYYKMKFNSIIDTFQESIEPIMLFIVACMVLLLALGIFLPMWDLSNAVQRIH